MDPLQESASPAAPGAVHPTDLQGSNARRPPVGSITAVVDREGYVWLARVKGHEQEASDAFRVHYLVPEVIPQKHEQKKVLDRAFLPGWSDPSDDAVIPSLTRPPGRGITQWTATEFTGNVLSCFHGLEVSLNQDGTLSQSCKDLLESQNIEMGIPEPSKRKRRRDQNVSTGEPVLKPKKRRLLKHVSRDDSAESDTN